MAPALGQHVAAEEGGDGLPTAEPGGEGRHRPGSVLGEELEQRLQVAHLDRPGVAPGEVACGALPEPAELDGLAHLWEPIAQLGPGPLEGAVDGGNASAECLSGLGGGEVDRLAQEEHGALARWEMLERSDIGELEVLVSLESGLRRPGFVASGGVGAHPAPR